MNTKLVPYQYAAEIWDKKSQLGMPSLSVTRDGLLCMATILTDEKIKHDPLISQPFLIAAQIAYNNLLARFNQKVRQN